MLLAVSWPVAATAAAAFDFGCLTLVALMSFFVCSHGLCEYSFIAFVVFFFFLCATRLLLLQLLTFSVFNSLVSSLVLEFYLYF